MKPRISLHPGHGSKHRPSLKRVQGLSGPGLTDFANEIQLMIVKYALAEEDNTIVVKGDWKFPALMRTNHNLRVMAWEVYFAVNDKIIVYTDRRRKAFRFLTSFRPEIYNLMAHSLQRMTFTFSYHLDWRRVQHRVDKEMTEILKGDTILSDRPDIFALEPIIQSTGGPDFIMPHDMRARFELYFHELLRRRSRYTFGGISSVSHHLLAFFDPYKPTIGLLYEERKRLRREADRMACENKRKRQELEQAMNRQQYHNMFESSRQPTDDQKASKSSHHNTRKRITSSARH